MREQTHRVELRTADSRYYHDFYEVAGKCEFLKTEAILGSFPDYDDAKLFAMVFAESRGLRLYDVTKKKKLKGK